MKLSRDFAALVDEKAQLQMSVNNLSEENCKQTQVISELNKTIQDLKGKLTVIKLQVKVDDIIISTMLPLSLKFRHAIKLITRMSSKC